jgi:hypothetical protein
MKIRSVRPEFFSDAKMAALTVSARLLYIGLWSYVDDEGRGEYLPKLIEGAIFPHEPVDFTSLWGELESIGRVVRYEVGGQSYFHIPKFGDHQRPNRKYDSKLPAPPSRTAHALRTDTANTAKTVETVPDLGNVSTQGARTAHAPLGEGEGEGEVAAALGDGFKAFLHKRAAAEVERRKFEGIKVRHTNGLIHDLTTNASEFIDESKRVWAHRDCDDCGGKGFTESYSPGGGMGRVECTREA